MHEKGCDPESYSTRVRCCIGQPFGVNCCEQKQSLQRAALGGWRTTKWRRWHERTFTETECFGMLGVGLLELKIWKQEPRGFFISHWAAVFSSGGDDLPDFRVTLFHAWCMWNSLNSPSNGSVVGQMEERSIWLNGLPQLHIRPQPRLSCLGIKGVVILGWGVEGRDDEIEAYLEHYWLKFEIWNFKVSDVQSLLNVESEHLSYWRCQELWSTCSKIWMIHQLIEISIFNIQYWRRPSL